MSALRFSAAAVRGSTRIDMHGEVPLQGVTALFGPSGAGKTTLLRIIAGLEPRIPAQISCGDDVWSDPQARRFVPTHERRLGYVTQAPALFDHLDVEGNLRFAAQRAERGAGTAASIRWDDVLAVLDLGPLLLRDSRVLSGGERQRVAIGRALLRQPRLLLLDEPLAAVDLVRKNEVLSYIERIAAGFAVPVIYVSHSLDEVARIAQRTLLLQDGRVTGGGATDDVLEQLDHFSLNDRFAGGALLSGDVVDVDADFALTRVRVGAEHLLLPGTDLAAGSRVRLYARARDVVIALQRPQGLSMRNCLPVRVLEVREDVQGPYAQIILALGEEHLQAQLTRSAVSELGLVPGREVFALLKSVAVASSNFGGSMTGT